MVGSTLTLPAFAKINWSLRVIGKRADGYHELDTIFQTISLHDTITLKATESPQIVLFRDDPSIPTGAGNLVHRAATALQTQFAPNQGAQIFLEKRIPPEAGLGGGSSDAAITLIGLTHLWKTGATAGDLLRIGTTLGADVPFFFFGGTGCGTGIGASIKQRNDAPGKFLLVVKPIANLSTARAYQAMDARSLTSADSKTILSSSQQREISDSFSSGALQNDFEPVAFELEPEIKRAKAALMKAGARGALLAGSGSAVFGIFDSGDAQERAIQAIELDAGWRVFPCKTVGRNHYRSAMGAAGEVLDRFSGHYAGA